MDGPVDMDVFLCNTALPFASHKILLSLRYNEVNATRPRVPYDPWDTAVVPKVD